MKRKHNMTIDDIQGSISYEKAIKYGILVGRPIHCKKCGRKMKPQMHTIKIKEGIFKDTHMVSVYEDKCEWCGNEFKYLA